MELKKLSISKLVSEIFGGRGSVPIFDFGQIWGRNLAFSQKPSVFDFDIPGGIKSMTQNLHNINKWDFLLDPNFFQNDRPDLVTSHIILRLPST